MRDQQQEGKLHEQNRIISRSTTAQLLDCAKKSTCPAAGAAAAAGFSTVSLELQNFMLELKQAAFSDAATFAAMEQGAGVREFILPYSQAEHEQSLRDSRLVYLQILDRNVLVGFLLLALDPDGASIEFRRIVVAIRGKGIGQAAISATERFCQSELGRTRIWLDVFEHNHRGRYIYEKLGYQKFGETHLDARLLLLYEKRL